MARRWVLLSLAVALFALTPLAHASPPDQTWLAGLYDNADYDDVVLLITSTVSVVQSSPPCSLDPTTAAIGAVVSRGSRCSYSAPHFHTAPRGPPLA